MIRDVAIRTACLPVCRVRNADRERSDVYRLSDILPLVALRENILSPRRKDRKGFRVVVGWCNERV